MQRTTRILAMIAMTALMRGMVDDMVQGGISALPGHVQIHHPAFLDDPSISNLLEPPRGELAARLEHADVLAWASRVRVPAVVVPELARRAARLGQWTHFVEQAARSWWKALLSEDAERSDQVEPEEIERGGTSERFLPEATKALKASSLCQRDTIR